MPAPVDHDFWDGRRVLLTGHTGFKGGWLALWLTSMGARVFGLALPTDTSPSFYALTNVADVVPGGIGDLRQPADVVAAVKDFADARGGPRAARECWRGRIR